MREYIDQVRASLRTKIITGYRQDDIMLIDETLKLEQEMINIVSKNLESYISKFEEFLMDDHTSAMQLLEQTATLATAAYSKEHEYELLAKQHSFLCTCIYKLEERWKQSKTYEKFLYNLSPLMWRLGRDDKRRRLSIYGAQDNSDDIFSIFETYRHSVIERGVSLRDILNEFGQEIQSEKEPELYFVHPEQLMDVYRSIEAQNLNAVLHSEELAAPLAYVKESMRMAEILFDEEIKSLEEIIEKLGVAIM